jgi:ABC-2 type transport system ATP-binding protein
MSVVLSSHLISDLERTCDWLIVLADGRVRLAGAIGELVPAHNTSLEDTVLTYLETK